MSKYKAMLEFEERLRDEYRQEFTNEHKIAEELFNLYIEATEITSQAWQLKTDKTATLGLINRIFNDLHCGFKLLMEGLLVQGMALPRDTIECAMYIKLFEVDEEFRREWLEGKNFLVRDVRERMKKNKISPPPQDKLYRTLCRSYVHPTKEGLALHVTRQYTKDLSQYTICRFGGIKDTPRIKLLTSVFLSFTYNTVVFLWQDIFPIDREEHPAWHDRMKEVTKSLYEVRVKADQEWQNILMQQLTAMQSILNAEYEAIDIEVQQLFNEDWPYEEDLADPDS